VTAVEETGNSLATANWGFIRELDAAAEAMRFDTAVRRVISVVDDDVSWSADVVCWWKSPRIKILMNNFIADLSIDYELQ